MWAAICGVAHSWTPQDVHRAVHSSSVRRSPGGTAPADGGGENGCVGTLPLRQTQRSPEGPRHLHRRAKRSLTAFLRPQKVPRHATASRTARNKCLLFKPPSLWYSIIAVELTKTEVKVARIQSKGLEGKASQRASPGIHRRPLSSLQPRPLLDLGGTSWSQQWGCSHLS